MIEDNDLMNIFIEFILTNKIQLKYVILESIIKNDINEKTKVMILNSQMDNLDRTTTFKLLNLIGGKYSDITKYSSKPLFEYNDVNKELVEKLENESYISSWSEEKSGIRVNTYLKEK